MSPQTKHAIVNVVSYFYANVWPGALNTLETILFIFTSTWKLFCELEIDSSPFDVIFL